MHVQVTHALGAGEARRRLERFVDALVARDWPGGVEVRYVATRWVGNHLDFAFVLARAFFSAPVAGTLDVDCAAATLETAIPPMVVAFVGEERIREVLARELAQALETP